MIGKPSSYSLQWARAVVADHVQEHARATWFCQRVFNISHEQMVRWLATNGIYWRLYKRMVKFAEAWLKERGDWSKDVAEPPAMLCGEFRRDWRAFRTLYCPELED